MFVLFDELDPILKGFWLVAFPVSLIFLMQTIITFAGMNWSGELHIDNDLDSSDAPFQMFTFRNLVNFLIAFSWSGIAFYSSIQNIAIVISLASLFGVFFVFIFFLMLKNIEKLSENGTFDIKKTIGMYGEVYLKIPKRYSGKGKILLSYKGSIKELDAVTEGEEISQQTQVKILSIIDSIVNVEKNKI